LDANALVEYPVDERVLEDNSAGGGHWNHPVVGARVLTLVETDPLMELPPFVHTVSDGGHAAGAWDHGSETAAYAVSNADVVWGVVVDGAEVGGMPP
jgi:hypothetical protein